MIKRDGGKGDTVVELRNEDPITGEPGAHPVGAGVGAALGGAAAGAAAGAVGGPVGAVAGAVAGGLAGGLAGKAVAEQIDPTVELEYWKSQYCFRPYYSEDREFQDYEPAYRAGLAAYDPAVAAPWNERESIARSRWENEGGAVTTMTWDEARVAAEDAYCRAHACSTKKTRK